MITTLVLFITAVILFYWEWIRKFTYWKRKGIPYLSGSFPFGTSRDFSWFTRFHGYLIQELYEKLAPNPYGGFYMWNHPLLLIRDPDMIRLIMTKDFQHFRDRGRLDVTLNQPIAQHLFNIDGDIIWRVIRMKLTPTFTTGKLKNMFSLFEVCALKLEEELKKNVNNGGLVNVKELMVSFTLDIISSCAFGLETHSAANEEFRKNTRKIFKSHTPLLTKIKIALCLMIPRLGKHFNLQFVDKQLEDYITPLILNTMKYRENNNIVRNDFLDLIIQFKNKSSADVIGKDKPENVPFEIKPTLLAAQCFLFLGAGFESSSSAQSYALFELAQNPHIQERLHKEIDEVTKKHGSTASYQSLQDMPYLEQIVSETLRKYTTLPLLTRQCTKRFTLPDRPDVTIEPGTKIIIPAYAIHHDATYYPDPERFDPDRFSPENLSFIKPYTYIPFGEGPRNCLASRFARLQTKIGLFTVLRKYQVLPAEDTPKSLYFSPTPLISSVDGPIKLLIQERNDI